MTMAQRGLSSGRREFNLWIMWSVSLILSIRTMQMMELYFSQSFFKVIEISCPDGRRRVAAAIASPRNYFQVANTLTIHNPTDRQPQIIIIDCAVEWSSQSAHRQFSIRNSSDQNQFKWIKGCSLRQFDCDWLPYGNIGRFAMEKEYASNFNQSQWRTE